MFVGVVCCVLCDVCCLLFVFAPLCVLLRVVCRVLFVANCALLVVCRLLFVVWCMLCVVCRVLSVNCVWSSDVDCLLCDC